MIKAFSIILLVPSLLLADTDPYFANKGLVLPADSWVFSPTKAKETRDRLIDADTQLKVNDAQKKQLDLSIGIQQAQDNNITLLTNQNNKLATNLADERTVGNLEKIIWFFGGVAATVLTLYGVQQATK